MCWGNLQGDIPLAIATVLAVGITGWFTVWQVNKGNKATIKQLKEQHKLSLQQLEKQHQDAIRQMQAETQVLKKRKFNDQMLEALQRCWGLLIYTSEEENIKSILTYTANYNKENHKKEETGRTYYFHKKQAADFINDLQKFYFADGWGVYLSEKLSTLLFEYNYTLFGIYFTAKNEEENKLDNNYFAKQLIAKHNEIVRQLKEEIYSPNFVG